jgi:hypothetical protein
MTAPLTHDEADLLATYRDSAQNDKTLLDLLLTAWADLSPAQRATSYRTADLFVSAKQWKTLPDEGGREKGR